MPLLDDAFFREHQDWLRRLAASLLRDEALADEVVQETWMTALRRAPEHAAGATPSRGWLATVARHLAWRMRRGETRRRRRERASAVDPAHGIDPTAPAGGDPSERLRTSEVLAQELRRLREPYRRTLCLRYLDELSLPEIARREQVSRAAVKSRLQRGLALLRAALDQRHDGGRRAWCLALAPLVRPRPSTALLFGVMSMSKVFLGAAAVTVGAALWLFVDRAVDPGHPALEDEPTALTPPSLSRDAKPAVPGDPVWRLEPATDEPSLPPAASTPASEAAPAPLRGVVLDAAGRRAPFIELAVYAGRERLALDLRSDADGAFALPRPSGAVQIAARAEGLLTVLEGVVHEELRSAGAVVVIARSIEAAGRVRDDHGEPVAGARLRYELPPGFSARLGLALDGAREVVFQTLCDGDGRFVLPRLPAIEGGSLRVEAGLAHEAATFDAPLVSAPALELVLPRRARAADRLRGLVLDSTGRGVKDAMVALGFAEARSDEAGAFEIEVRGASPWRLAALHREHGAAFLDLPAVREEWPDFPALVLSDAASSLAGVVREEDGMPVPGAQVWIADPTFFGSVGGASAHAEEILATSGYAMEVETDAAGRFEIDGLLAREYTLGALDPRTLRTAHTKPRHAGAAGIEIVLPATAGAPLAGRLVSRDGTPVPAASVSPQLVYREVFGRPGAPPARHSYATSPVLTDAEGRFHFAAVHPAVDVLFVDGEPVMPGPIAIQPGSDRSALQLVVPRRCHVEVEVTGAAAAADSLAFLDAAGHPLDLVHFEARSSSSSTRWDLIDGRSGLLAVSDAAARLVLFAAGKPLLEQPVDLHPGPPQRIHLHP